MATLFILVGTAEGRAVEEVVELDTVTVSDQREEEIPEQGVIKRANLASEQARTSDTASLFKDVPGVSVNTGGGVSGIPAIRGLADDRVKLEVNGKNITSACSNHMNPPLSYVAPSSVGKARVMAGITPVSDGGDSLGGTISVDPAAPRFATEEEGTYSGGALGSFFRSANDNFGNSASATYATRDFSLDYNGAWSKGINYRTGNSGTPVIPSSFLSTTHAFRASGKLDRGLVTADLTGQYIPYQGFPNQRMDVTANEAILGGLNYESEFDWGKLDAKFFYHYTWHRMNMLPERNSGRHLMRADGSDLGYRVRAHIPLGEGQTVRVGNEFFRQTLQDWWPGKTMGPEDYLSVNDGQRNRVGTFVEWQADWNDRWTAQFGVRNDMVFMDAGQVHGYGNNPVEESWAQVFNASDRAHTDANFDITALVRYTPNAYGEYELGFARKMRAPNLYERYAWNGDALNVMINWFGDGNGYQGNLGLKSEIAYNFAFTAGWHDAADEVWSVKLAPFYTHVEDYIWGQQERINPFTGFRGMQFVNLPFADLYGADASGRYAFLRDADVGNFAVRASLSYVRGVGENGMRGRPCPYTGAGGAALCNAQGWPLDGLQSPDKVNLYHMMPLHGTLALEHDIETEWGSFANALAVELVDRKTAVAKTYGEPETPGYALLNIRTGYRHKQVRVDLGVDNLLDKSYFHPLGGTYIHGTYAQVAPGEKIPRLLPVPAMGRSVYVTLNLEF